MMSLITSADTSGSGSGYNYNYSSDGTLTITLTGSDRMINLSGVNSSILSNAKKVVVNVANIDLRSADLQLWGNYCAIPEMSITGYRYDTVEKLYICNFEGLTSISIPQGVYYKWVFVANAKLTTASFFNGRDIDRLGLKDCYYLKELTVPDMVRKIEITACDNLKSIEGNSVLTRVLVNDAARLTTVTVNSNLSEYYLTDVRSTSINVPKSNYTEITACNFQKITFENGITEIAGYTAQNCRKLTEVTIPKSVTYIDRSAFSGCSTITTVNYAGSQTEWRKITNATSVFSGAKVNYNIVPFDRVLSNGDQVEIITSKKQIPKAEWLDVVRTARARRCIRDFIRNEQTGINAAGEELLKSYFEEFNVEYSQENIDKIYTATLSKSMDEFWNNIVTHKISKNKIRKILAMKQPKELAEFQKKIEEEIANKSLDELIDEQFTTTPNAFLLDNDYERIKYVLADCCNPLPGDQVVGFQVTDDKIVIHQTSCPNAIEQMSKFGKRIIKTKWRKGQDIAFLSGIRFSGFDRKGMLKEIIEIVSSQMDLNMRSIHIEAKQNIFSGTMMLYIQSVRALTDLIEKLRGIDQLETVERIGYDVD